MVKSLMRYALAWLALVAAGLCWAQDAPDNILQSYALATESLNEAVASLPEDGALSREALDRATQTLRPLSRDTSSTTLVAALENTFVRAATAIQNESPSDLAVQVAVLEGGVQRLVYESALRAANEGDLETARTRLSEIAADMAFSESDLAALAEANSFPRLIAAFDIGTAAAVQQSLGAASEQSDDKAAAYTSLARAYGTFLPVQDSPRVAADVNEQFTQAFQTLLGDESEGFSQSLIGLTQTMSAFESAAQAALAGNAPITLPPPPSTDTPEDTTVDGETAEVAPTDTAVAPTETAISGAETASGENDALLPDTPASGTADAGADEPRTVITADALEATEQSLRRSELAAAFNELGLVGADQEELISSYLDNGFSTVSDALDTLYVSSSRALVAIETGDQETAQNHIGTYQATYERFLSPLVANTSPLVDSGTARLASSLIASPSLRLQDAAVLVGNVNSVTEALDGIPPSATHQTLLSTSLVWSGWLRLLVTLLLGILAFIPLRLLNLAFGGANRNWRLIGIALFLLLLPIIYEGLSSLAALLANLLNFDALNTLSAFSLFQNTLSQVIWVVITALAILLAIAGLYGICVQFGLLGKSNSNETIISTQEMSTQANTSPDWDEEF